MFGLIWIQKSVFYFEFCLANTEPGRKKLGQFNVIMFGLIWIQKSIFCFEFCLAKLTEPAKTRLCQGPH